jgi:hypothetical protein
MLAQRGQNPYTRPLSRDPFSSPTPSNYPVCVYRVCACVFVYVHVCAKNVHAYMRVVRACVFARVLGFVHARVCVHQCIFTQFSL